MLARLVVAAFDGLQLQWLYDKSVDMADGLTQLVDVLLAPPARGLSPAIGLRLGHSLALFAGPVLPRPSSRGWNTVGPSGPASEGTLRIRSRIRCHACWPSSVMGTAAVVSVGVV